MSTEDMTEKMRPAAETAPAAEPAAKTAVKKTNTRKKTTAVKSATKASTAKATTTKTAAAKTTAAKATTKRAAAKTTAAKSTTAKTTRTRATTKAAVQASAPVQAPVEEPKAPVEAPVETPAPQPVEAPAAPAAKAAASSFADLPPVLIAAAECAPLAKAGGLADVVGALPKYLREIGVEARIIMPFHRQIKQRYATETQHLFDFEVKLGWRTQYAGIEKLVRDDTTYYFVDNEFYFGGPLYCGGEFEGEQYAFFTRAVMDALPNLDFTPGILHCNDWHTAMMPMLAKTQYAGGPQGGLKSLMTIHNLKYQGVFGHEQIVDLLGIEDRFSTPEFMELNGADNMLKAGIVFADKVNTVSPTYAHEITTLSGGEGLDGILRARDIGGDLMGVLNGIDYDVWNPATDEHVGSPFTAEDLSGKAQAKAALARELGLDEGDGPLLAMVGRLVPQKGIDLVRDVLDEVIAAGARVIVLGTGYPEYEAWLRDAEWRHHGRLCSYIGYNDELAHRIYAGADFFLMPSLFEPCGISQMISMRYGTLPIVRETGGLKDTVVPYNAITGEGTGFTFTQYESWDLRDAIMRALAVYADEPTMKSLIQQAMAADFSFGRCARSYAEAYQRL